MFIDKKDVPEQLRRGYSGNKFQAIAQSSITIHGHEGNWDGGSRNTFRLVRISDGESVTACDTVSAPWDDTRKDHTIDLKPGFAVVEHSIFRGKDMGLRYTVHPDDIAKMITNEAVELTAFEKIVLTATRSYKSSYGGKDRYEMAQGDYRYKPEGLANYPTREQWDAAKQTLIERKMLNKRGAITTIGRNAVS